MKIKNVLFAFLFTSFFLSVHAQRFNSDAVFSLYGGLEFQFTNFSDINDQIKTYDIPTLDYGLVAFNIGAQFDIPNTPFASSLEASFVETCPEDIEEYPTQVLVRGHGFKFKQSASIFERNDWSIIPTLGVGYQKTSLRINGEYSSDESGQLVTSTIDNKTFQSNYYTEFGIGFEKAASVCGDSNSFMYFGSSLSFRKPIGVTNKGTSKDAAIIDISKTNFNRPVLDFYVRFNLF